MNEALMVEETTTQPKQQAMVEIESQRSIQEVQASMTIAKKFPRDTMEVFDRIIESCKRPSLADQAMYAYPRGDKVVTGESIRLAELLIREWGNSVFGIRELRQDTDGGYSDVEAFAWDLQTNTKQIKTFTVPHIRYSKKKGNTRLTDPRDIYEMVANQGARRMRACILGLVPIDIREAAIEQCEQTLSSKIEGNKEDFARKLILDFKELDVTKEMIEKLIGCPLAEATRKDLANLVKIRKSVKDGIVKRQDFFEVAGSEVTEAAEDLADKIAKRTNGEKKPESTEPKEEPKTDPKTDEPTPRSLWAAMGLPDKDVTAKFKTLRQMRVDVTDKLFSEYEIKNDGDLADYFEFKSLTANDISPADYDKIVEFLDKVSKGEI